MVDDDGHWRGPAPGDAAHGDPDGARSLAESVGWAYETELGALARWLHDGPLQALVAARRVLELADGAPEGLVDMAVDAIDVEIDGLREHIAALDAGGLDRVGLAGTLAELLAGRAEIDGDLGPDGAAEAMVGPLRTRLALRAALWLLEGAADPVGDGDGPARVALHLDPAGPAIDVHVTGRVPVTRAVPGPGRHGAAAVAAAAGGRVSPRPDPSGAPGR